MKVVLLGSLPKGDDKRAEWVDWKKPFVEAIRKELPDVEFIHGDSISDNVGAELVVGHDLAQVQAADVCVVDAAEKIGAGTAQEIVIAKYFSKPVVIMMPPDTHHRRSNVTFHGVEMEEWVHPFLKVGADYIANSIEDVAEWISSYAANPEQATVKDITAYTKAIEAYNSEQS